MLRPEGLLAPHRQGLLLSSFRRLDRSKPASRITTRANSQFPRPDLHRQETRHYGLRTRDAEGMTASEAEAYARKPEWSPSYRNGMLGALVTAYRWAERGQIISRIPLRGIQKPPKASRGAKSLVPAETHARLCEHADAFFRAFLQLLWMTGARPGEIASLNAKALDLANGIVLLSEHKCAHLGKSR